MLKATIEQTGATRLLTIEGGLIIEHAEELKNVFLEALNDADSLTIHLERVDNVDLFGLQVLCSAHRLAMKSGTELKLAGERPEALRNAIDKAGFGRLAACSADIICPWNEE